MINQKDYWDKKIKPWSDSSYKRARSLNLIEWLAGFFRGPITGRMEVALKVIGPKATGKIVADFGCGVGDFCFRVLEYQPKKVIGLDISAVAVAEATKRVEEAGIKDKVEFFQADLGKLDELPEFDFAVGLGFIDYLDKGELTHLFEKLRDRLFFFSFPEKKLSVINFLQAIYLKTQKCPGAYKYTRDEMEKIIPKGMNYHFLEKDQMLFITNI
ncbi:class I SAM-dependent methyltransferase [Candidatus Gottesmanbacteria bacterium]|nr:class I SAM-dependent methyltransferase [Candidatus Gottesmanbacteria bacterium]